MAFSSPGQNPGPPPPPIGGPPGRPPQTGPVAGTASSPSPPPSSPPPPRAFAPDLARGVMLLLIAIANVTWYQWGQGVDLATPYPTEGSTFDRLLRAVSAIVVDGRVYPMFAFLFGYGMVQFMAGRERRGDTVSAARRMLRRRHWAMILFGVAHAFLLFMGDILAAYGLAGLVLCWIFFNRRDLTLKIWIGVFLGLLALATLLSLLSGLLLMAAPAEMLPPADAQQAGLDQSPGYMRENLVSNPDYLASALQRLAFLALLAPMQGLGLAVPIAILGGWLAARHRVLDDPERHRRVLLRLAVIGIPIGWLGGLPSALHHLQLWSPSEIAWWMFQLPTMFTGIFGGIGYVAFFGLVAARFRRRGAAEPGLLTRAVTAVGQRSLTFYLLQSIVFAPLLSAWGLGLGSQLGTAGVYLLAVSVWVVSVGIALVLDRRNLRGPFEVMLRRLTYGSGQR